MLETITLPDARGAAAALGQKLLVLEASTVEEIDAQFASLDREPADAMLVTTSPFFVTRAGQIAALAARHRIPAIYYRPPWHYVEGRNVVIKYRFADSSPDSTHAQEQVRQGRGADRCQ